MAPSGSFSWKDKEMDWDSYLWARAAQSNVVCCPHTKKSWEIDFLEKRVSARIIV